MSEFITYLKLGFQHITDLKGFDHILFILALCAIYKIADWRKIAILVTAFTIGHTVTLALSTLNILTFNQSLIEFLIPITILITCIFNLIYKIPDRKPIFQKKSNQRYYLALFFGLIHGMGFSNYLKSLLGKEEFILKPLFAFNLGLEAGQLIIVGISVLIATFFISLLKVKQQDWKQVISGVVAGLSIMLIKDSAYFSELFKS
jgi:HupE / UreJ protein